MDKVAFHTLGCKVNHYETEAMGKLFEEAGYKIVNSQEEADIYVINTCTVTNLSDRKSRQFIRKSSRKNKKAIIAVVGCYSQISPEMVEKIDGVDVIIGTDQRKEIVNLCEKAKNEKKPINIVRDSREYKEFEKIAIDEVKSRTRAYLKVQDGCNQFCSYCIIPYARGPVRSRELDQVVEEVKKLSHRGFKEIILTGIHIASYGKDLETINLSGLIKEISQLAGIERIRLSSLEPNIINESFMESIVESKKVCDHFHLSLQSGSNRVLKSMRRRYDKEEYRAKVELIRRYMPRAGITTDIIVGFPGERDEDFKETMDYVKEIGFSKIHVFQYSPRQGTPASNYPNQILSEKKLERSQELINLGDSLRDNFYKKFIGEKFPVLYEGEIKGEKDMIEGYTSNYMRVKSPGKGNMIGQILTTDLLDIKEDFLMGKIGR